MARDEMRHDETSLELRPLKHDDQHEEEGRALRSPSLLSSPARAPVEEPSLVALVLNRRFMLLALVCVQNAGFSLLRRYATAIARDHATTSSMLALQEVLKLVFCMGMMLRDKQTQEGRSEHGSFVLFVAAHSGKMLVPASIFGCMNVLGFISLRYIPAGLFAVLQQCKLLTTALLSRLLLGRQLSWAKWRALLLLLAGVVLITYEANRVVAEEASTESQDPDEQYAPQHLANETNIHGGDDTAAHLAQAAGAGSPSQRRRGATFVLGVGAVLLEALLSGFATVYFEKVLKSTPLSIWHRNVQLAVWSLCIFVPMAVYDSPDDPLRGWGVLAVANGVVGAAGGLLVALAIVQFDSVIKSVAVATSIVLTVLLGHFMLAGPMSLPIAIASAVVIVATVDYTFSA